MSITTKNYVYQDMGPTNRTRTSKNSTIPTSQQQSTRANSNSNGDLQSTASISSQGSRKHGLNTSSDSESSEHHKKNKTSSSPTESEMWSFMQEQRSFMIQMDKKLDKLQQTNDDMQKSLQSLKEEVNTNKIEIVSMKNKVSDNTDKITNVTDKLSALESKMQKTEKILRMCNLNVVGIAEEQDETRDSLKTTIRQLFHDITGRVIDIDTVFRFGKRVTGKPRILKVKFKSLDDRNEVYSNRNKTISPVYVNEDLTYEEYKLHSVLRAKTRELVIQGIDAKMNYKNLCVDCPGKKYWCNDNYIIQEEDINPEVHFLGGNAN